MLLLPGSLVLLDRLRGDRRCVLSGVRDLRIGCSRGDRAPSLTARHSQRYRAAGEERKDYGFDDLVHLLSSHNFIRVSGLVG